MIDDAKNQRNRLNHSCRKTRFKNITSEQIDRFGPLSRVPKLTSYCCERSEQQTRTRFSIMSFIVFSGGISGKS